MFDFWKDDLTDEETEALIDKAADEIQKRGLKVPAILALEMHKPLSNLVAHATMAFAPFSVPFLGFDFVNDYSRLLQNSDNLERLIRKLETSDPSNTSRLSSGTEAPCQST